MKLSAVLAFLDLDVASSFDQCELLNIKIDSRQVQPGDLFVAVPGSTVDGRDYVAQAIRNGAAAVLIHSSSDIHTTASQPPIISVPNLKTKLAALATYFYQSPANKLKLIGITGTNGKTSCSHYTAQILCANNITCGVMGTIGNGLLGDLRSSNLTTADCCSVQQQLAEFVVLNTQCVAMEVSSHSLVQDRLDGLQFHTAVFTNLSQDHLDYHANMLDYFAAKSLLFTAHKPENSVINIDDPLAYDLIALIDPACKVFTYSISNPQADIYLLNDQVVTPWGTAPLIVPLVGSFNKSNVLACIACACLQGLKFSDVMYAVQKLMSVSGRMQRVPCNDPQAPQVIVDYAHTPDAVKTALQAVREYCSGKLYCIVGCGGDRDRSKRPLMLRAALEYSDHVVVTQDNPRTEDPQQILSDMLEGNADYSNFTVELDRAQAIMQTIATSDSQDLILIAGKGHEDYQIIGTERLPFSDLLVAQQGLLNLSEKIYV